MREQILSLINEQTSPLFRIMSIYNHDAAATRSFDNNICAFHIGNGFIASVAHNLTQESQLVRSIDNEDFENGILAHCNVAERTVLNRIYQLDQRTQKRQLRITNQNDVQPAIDAFKRVNYDTRWLTQYERGLCKPFLIIQFEDNQFYKDPVLTALFNRALVLHEPSLGVHTFLIELELVEVCKSEDIAIYQMTGIDQRLIERIPTAAVSYDSLLINESLYCLQASTSGTNLGRMLNESRIEGILDHHAVFGDRIGGNYVIKGMRYLLKGYFRFGSSGAPYFLYDSEAGVFKVNAVQSEASPIQLAINNTRDGNFQYVNAIASPLSLVRDKIDGFLTE